MTKLIALCVFLQIFSIKCGQQGDEGKKRRFYSESAPGIWANLPDDHTPQVEVKPAGEDYVITVEVAFKPVKEPKHYIEVLALMDGKKQLAAQTFKFSYSPARAQFELPAGEYKDLWVLAKCNKHDMWRAAVSLK